MNNPERLFRIVALCALIWALVLCAGCAQIPVEHIVLDDAEAVTNRYRLLGGRTEELVGGFQYWRGEVCVIVYRADIPDKDRCIRHEFDHCLWGDWHPNQSIEDC